MVKAPSSHGLDRKYKSWRRGKSKHSKLNHTNATAATTPNKRSLKQQIRGLERLLRRVTDDDQRQGLTEKLQALQRQVQDKQAIERERKHAKESHGTRFLERQKLVRLFANASKNTNAAALDRIALDQVYVAHFCFPQRYLPLFRHGARRVDPPPVLAKRAKLRATIFLTGWTDVKDWIAPGQYDRVRKILQERGNVWTVDDERAFFGQLEPRAKAAAKAVANDSRFSQTSAAVLAAAEKVEKELEDEEAAAKQPKNDNNGDDDESSSNDDDNDEDDDDDDSKSSESSSDSSVDPLKPSKRPSKRPNSTEQHTGNNNKKQRLPATDDTASVKQVALDQTKEEESEEDVGDDTSSSSSSSSSTTSNRAAAPDDDDDDFLVPASSATNVFSNPHQKLAQIEKAVKGDKSQGWSTQKQRPGQYRGGSTNNQYYKDKRQMRRR